MEETPIYFTYPSPFCSLAWHRITTHPERYKGIKLRWTPIMFRRLMALSGGASHGSPPLQLEYNYADARRWARYYGIPLKTPERRDPANQTAHKVHLLAQDAGGQWEQKWMAAVHTFMRVEGRDVTDPVSVENLARSIALPGLGGLESPSLDDRLEENTRAALRDGVCGVPFIQYNGEAYWGNDRLAWLEAQLAGKPLPPGM